MELRYAYGYVRVSTDKQEELSPDSQKKLLLEYAENNNILLKEIFFELGVSGRNAQKRPEFQRMIGLSKSPEHPVDVILVWKFSRFARNQEESIVYKSLLKKQHKIDVISISEPLIDGPFGSLIERIIEWMDEYYSIRLSGEVLRGMKEKALHGGYQTSPCLGYQAVGEGKPFIINEEEFKIVEYICTQFDVYNLDFTAIARRANEMGYHTKRNRLFDARGIERILTNPFYYGLVIWKDYSFIGTHEVRYTKAEFDRRMKKIQNRKLPSGRRNISACRHWLSGLLKCGICGASLAYGNNAHSPGFQCYKYSKGMHPCSCFISEKKAVSAVAEYLELLLKGMNLKYRHQQTQIPEQKSQYASLLSELESLRMREQRIRLAFEKGVDSLEEYRENKERFLKYREYIRKQLETLKTSPGIKSSENEDTLSHLHTIHDIIHDSKVDYSIKGLLLRRLVENIVLDKQNNQLIFHVDFSKSQ